MNWAGVAGRLRLPLGFVSGALYLLTVRPAPARLAFGAFVALLGLLLRAWAAGHIAKNQKLATAGPYAYTRNPLYLGSFLIALGFGIAWSWWALPLVAAAFLAVYFPVMQREAATLRTIFPEEYPLYAASVPVFFPRLTPWRRATSEPEPFRFELYLRHGEWKAAMGYTLAVLWLVFRAHWGS